MSIRFRSEALKSSVAILGALSCAALLSGCMASRFTSPLTTSSVNTAANADINQAMPDAVAATQLPPAGQYLSANNSRAPYIPAASVGQSNTQTFDTRDPLASGAYPQVQAAPNMGQVAVQQPQVVRRQLPTLTQNPVTSTQSMPAMPSLAEVDLTTAPKIDNTTTASIAAAPRAVPDNAFIHKIAAGESLYAIARQYDVTTDSIVAANGLTSPDKIFVGQDVIIPGRPGMVAPKISAPQSIAAKEEASKPVKVAEVTTPPASIPDQTNVAAPVLTKPATTPVAPTRTAEVEPQQIAPIPIARPASLPATAPKVAEVKNVAPKPAPTDKVTVTASVDPVKVAAPVAKEPKAASGSFRWPVKGRVIADFKASKNTGVNIEVPEGSSVRATENGEVIYVGNAVEGFGNLVLIKHSNGFVSAYAHLKDITIAKGAIVDRGDSIGTVGMTGAVSRPQLHFELRKGATPVDPMPLLAS
ncbi:peptidoglycan DD-metalloendopeptidase family protein [Maritalea porphyrae]|uniref:LysM domain-containing protein n=1 Tax=Maritalea porphyrae TaxID=880732 RepID=A0ABQ5USS6_9HYPH|nr:M23 family metallopeptidase [Maritalea porphyrae]GLQ18341.1 hypothetical protein GCM10007879_25900 [Maritalea porphyrae]